jgi:hypothetical protein
MRGIAKMAALLSAVALGGCHFKTEGNVFSTVSGDHLPLTGKMTCQSYGDDGKPEGNPAVSYLVSLKNGPNQQYLWLGEDWQRNSTRDLALITAHRVYKNAFLFVVQPGPEPGQAVYSIRATENTLEVRVYDAVRVMEVAKNHGVQATEEKYHAFSLKGDQDAQSVFLRELNRSMTGSHLVFGCALDTGASDKKD